MYTFELVSVKLSNRSLTSVALKEMVVCLSIPTTPVHCEKSLFTTVGFLNHVLLIIAVKKVCSPQSDSWTMVRVIDKKKQKVGVKQSPRQPHHRLFAIVMNIIVVVSEWASHLHKTHIQNTFRHYHKHVACNIKTKLLH